MICPESAQSPGLIGISLKSWWCSAFAYLQAEHACGYSTQGLLLLQDIKLANAAAWNNLGAANEDEVGQKGAEEEEDGGDPMWNTFQSRDDIEREKVSQRSDLH